MKTAVILLGHGSQAECGNDALAEVAAMVRERGGLDVSHAYLQFCRPDLAQAVDEAAAHGARKIIVLPYFLYLGNHVSRDIPDELGRLKEKHPGVEFVLAEHLGAHPKLAEIVFERIKKHY